MLKFLSCALLICFGLCAEDYATLKEEYKAIYRAILKDPNNKELRLQLLEKRRAMHLSVGSAPSKYADLDRRIAVMKQRYKL